MTKKEREHYEYFWKQGLPVPVKIQYTQIPSGPWLDYVLVYPVREQVCKEA